MKKWLRAQPDQPDHDRRPPGPARRLRRGVQPPPAAPLARPTEPPRPPSTHADPRPPRAATGTTTPTTASATTTVDKAGKVTLRYDGRLLHIGIGRTHAGTRVILLVQDLDIRVINAATGELLRELILDPTKRLPAHRTTTRPHPK